MSCRKTTARSSLLLPVSLPFLLATGLVALGWLSTFDMLRATLLSMDAASLGPGMTSVARILLWMDGVPMELWQSLCRTDTATGFSWEAWRQASGMAALMTLATMLPFATPAWRILRTDQSAISAFGFLGGYGGVWLLFAIGVATIDLCLHLEFGPHLVSTRGTAGVLAAGFVIAAGVFQWTSLKARGRLSVRWRHGSAQACPGDASVNANLLSGLNYGFCCLRSNGLLMSTMIAFGMMNVAAMALVFVAMLLEKAVVKNHVSRAIGLCLVLAGGAWMSAAVTG